LQTSAKTLTFFNKYKLKMKKKVLLPVVLLFVAAAPALSQTYKTVADTAALNKEYDKVNMNIANLTVALDKAQTDLGKYQSKADKASSDAESTATATADKATHATNGSVRDARRAKKEARRSVRDAKDSRRAGNDLEDQNKRIIQLTADLEKNQARLKELDAMRSSINIQ
jgi:chromosome segregation ATPase